MKLNILSNSLFFKPFVVLTLFTLGLVFSIYLLFLNLGRFPLENWDEAFYGQATRELMQTKDFIVLHWDYQVWLDKGPLQIWINAILASIFGLSEFSIRLVSAVSAFIIACWFLVYSYRKFALISTIIGFVTLILNNVFIWRARSGNLDLLVTLLIFLSYFVVLSKNKYKYPLLGLLFAGIFLTKVTLVAFPLLIFILHEFIYKRKYIRRNALEYPKFLAVFLGISGLWLLLGYLEQGWHFVFFYLTNSDGTANISNFSTDYISFTYYALQRRFFWLLLVGFIFIIKGIRKPENFLLLLYSCLLPLVLSFSSNHNNWYLLPSMPFWSLTISFAVYHIINIFKKQKVSLIVTAAIVLLSAYVSFKTYRENIIPILNSSSTIDQAQSAKVIKQLTDPQDVIVRLDALLPTTLYYAERITYTTNVSNSLYNLSSDMILSDIAEKKIKWFVGTNQEVNDFIQRMNISQYDVIRVNPEETILKVK